MRTTPTLILAICLGLLACANKSGLQPNTPAPNVGGQSPPSGGGGAPDDDPPEIDAATPLDVRGSGGAGGNSGAVDPPATGGAAGAPAACTNLPRARDPYRLVDAFPGLPAFDAPTAALQAPGQPGFIYVAEQGGRVKRFANRADASMATTVLDISARVETGGDAGLLGIAFHPQFVSNGEVFLSYALRGPVLKSRLSRFRASNQGASINPASEEVLIEIEQPDPEQIHLNCDIHFGADGHLWVGFGDGGFDEDSRNVAQSLGSLSGKILRIDVNRRGVNTPYAIPDDNPYAAMAGARGEIWAVGFRNPWRWRFDPSMPGALWVGELGSDRREEVNRVVKGGNYGWNRLEGTICLSPPCDMTGVSNPTVEYKHSEGKSITVGPVYLGASLPALRNRLIYGDFISGHVWALTPGGAPELILNSGRSVVSFGEMADNEIYVVDWAAGRLLKVAGAEAGVGLPTSLAETGCLERGSLPAHIVPYEVNAQLWSDGASKRRWMAIPPGGKIGVDAQGDFQFPRGTTLVKEFSVGATKVETRLFILHGDGEWAGYSYGWNAAQTDATLVPLSSLEVQKTVGSAAWSHPTRYHCMACHTREAGYALGPELAQLNRNYKYADGERNQLTQLQTLGLLAAPLSGPPASLPALPSPEATTAPLASRARAYLHANCSGCHRTRADNPEGMDLRFSTPLPATRACNVESVYGGFPGANRRIAVGQPAASVITRFIRSTDELRMPLVGTSRVDTQGATLIESWIQSLTSCN